MTSAKQLIPDDQRQEINAAVQQAESRTAAEIVPVVARASGRYDRPEDIGGLWLAVIAMAAVWFIYPLPTREVGDWSGWPAWGQLAAMVAAAVVGFIAGAVITGYVDWVRRLFTLRTQMRDEVAGAARTAFFDSRVHHTGGATGLLIYVSLFERRATVLADSAIIEKLGQPEIDSLRDLLTAQLKQRTPGEAICTTIEAAAEKLAPVLPATDRDVNELPDALVLIEGA